MDTETTTKSKKSSLVGYITKYQAKDYRKTGLALLFFGFLAIIGTMGDKTLLLTEAQVSDSPEIIIEAIESSRKKRAKRLILTTQSGNKYEISSSHPQYDNLILMINEPGQWLFWTEVNSEEILQAKHNDNIIISFNVTRSHEDSFQLKMILAGALLILLSFICFYLMV